MFELVICLRLGFRSCVVYNNVGVVWTVLHTQNEYIDKRSSIQRVLVPDHEISNLHHNHEIEREISIITIKTIITN